jgi:hypothetical protein
MSNKYAVISGLWSDIAVWSDTDGGAGGAAVPADGDAVFISAGINVQMDVDLSAYTGLQTVTIRGGDTPGMLYYKAGASGYLKIRTGYNLVGASGANKGRLLANSDGVWGNTGELAYADKAIIDLQGTAKVDAQYLGIALYCKQPIYKSVRTYGTKYDFTASELTVDTANNTIDLGTTPPTAGTAVMITTSIGTLPGGLLEDTIYYVRAVSGNTCKLAEYNSDSCIVDITSVGSGTCTLFTGHTNTATTTIKVLDDVTGDSCWSTTTGHNRVVLVNYNNDIQRLQLSNITSSEITLSANVDSVQNPGARIWLISRNVSIRFNGSQSIIDYSSATTSSGTFQCEIVNTAATLSGNGIYFGSGHTVSGSISGCSIGINYGSGHTVSGSISGCGNGINTGSGHTVSGTISGCSYGINYGSGHTVSGTISGCNNGINYGSGHTVSGTISGCGNGIYFGSGHTVSGSISGCGTGINRAGFTGYGMILLNNTVDVVYSGIESGPLLRGRSFKHGGTPNDTRAWSAGGTITHETSEVPSGKTYSHKLTFVDGGYSNVMEWEITRVESLSLFISAWAKNDILGLAEQERLHFQIIDPYLDPLINASASPLVEWIAADSTDWQSWQLDYNRPDDRPLLFRICAKRSSGNAYAYFDPSGGGGHVCGGGHVLGRSLVR